MNPNPFARPTSRDTPEQIDQPHKCGYRRQVEIDGVGIWEHPDWPWDAWTGAEEALEHAHAHYADKLKPSRLDRIRRR
jgi:hypothetical protein